MIRIPLSQSGPADEFAKAVENYRKLCHIHMMGRPGKPAPTAREIVRSLVERRPQAGNPATRGPDEFVILPYEIFDDTPASPELQLLRDSINQGA